MNKCPISQFRGYKATVRKYRDRKKVISNVAVQLCGLTFLHNKYSQPYCQPENCAPVFTHDQYLINSDTSLNEDRRTVLLIGSSCES